MGQASSSAGDDILPAVLPDGLLATLVAELDGPDVIGVALGGRFARGAATAYSDVDLAPFYRAGTSLPRKRLFWRDGWRVSVSPLTIAAWREQMARADGASRWRDLNGQSAWRRVQPSCAPSSIEMARSPHWSQRHRHFTGRRFSQPPMPSPTARHPPPRTSSACSTRVFLSHHRPQRNVTMVTSRRGLGNASCVAYPARNVITTCQAGSFTRP